MTNTTKQKLNQSKSRTSEVVRTFNELCFNLLSLDHRGQFNLNASAKYSMSFESGHISEAFLINSLNSEKGIILKLTEIKESSSSILLLESPDFFEISSLCLFNSSNKNSGTYNFNLSENNISHVLPLQDIKDEIIIFASTTSSIDCYNDFSFLNFLCNDAFISLPIFKASFSVSFDSFTIDLNKINCDNLFFIASLATADQLISSNSSIWIFNSSETDNVIAVIFLISLFNTNYLFKINKVFKSFGVQK